jgi:hypothetical protein
MIRKPTKDNAGHPLAAKPKTTKLRDATGYQALFVDPGFMSKDEPYLAFQFKSGFDIVLLEEDEAKKLFDLLSQHFGFKTA